MSYIYTVVQSFFRAPLVPLCDVKGETMTRSNLNSDVFTIFQPTE